MMPKRLLLYLLLCLLGVTSCGGTSIAPPPPAVTAETTPTNTLPVASPSPSSALPQPCPVLRPAPTFGISLLDTQTGQLLCERNPNGIAQPASTTKVMAALLTEEYLLVHHLSLDTLVTAEAVDTHVELDAGIITLSLGLGFLIIVPLSGYFTKESHWWPSIPGSILVLVGIALFIGGNALEVLNFLRKIWPVALIIIGLFLLWQVVQRKSAD